MTWKKRLLSAKHWQIFLLLYAIPLVFQISAIFKITTRMTVSENGMETGAPSELLLLMAVVGLYVVIHFGWMFTVATELQKMIAPEIPMKIKKFLVFWTFPLLYFSAFAILLGAAAASIEIVAPEQILSDYFPWFLMAHLTAMLGIFYSNYFCAKTLGTAEQQKPLRFIDTVPDMVLFWMLPVGIWVLQPRLNKLLAGREVAQ